MPGSAQVLPNDLFSFAVAAQSALYTALLYAFGEANEGLQTQLALDDVRAQLRQVGWVSELDGSELAGALQQMREWHLVEASQNHSEQYRTAHEYERRNLQYSLTRAGEAALEGHQAAVAALQSSGGLQTAVLDAIADALMRLAELARHIPDIPPGAPPSSQATAEQRRTFTTFSELTSHLDAMRTGIRAFNSDLQRLLRAEGVDEATFRDVKEATIHYLDEYVTRLDDRAARIREAMTLVRDLGLEPMLHSALVGAELPPHPDAQTRDHEWLDHARARWAGLEAWFAPNPAVEARAQRLSTTARRAIVSLLQVVDRMRTARRRPSSVQADLRRVARLFAAAPGDDDLHRIWRATFGLHPARHTSLGHSDPDLVPRGTSWADAEAVPVTALLRESGLTEKFARPARVREVSSLRAERAARARAERTAAERAIRQLGVEGPVHVSDLGVLDTETFAAFLDLLGRAVARVPQRGSLLAASSDGRITVRLVVPARDARASLRTSAGVLECPDYELHIASTTPTAVPA